MGQAVGADHLWRVNVYHMREKKWNKPRNCPSWKILWTMMLRLEGWCICVMSHTWVKQLDVSAPQVRARGEFRLLCTVLRQEPAALLLWPLSLDGAARSVLIVLKLCKGSALSRGGTGLKEGSTQRICGLLQGRKSVLVGKPAVHWSREESWGGATKSMCPRKTSLADRGCLISLLRINLIFRAFKQTWIWRELGELTAKHVSSQPISVRTKLCGMHPNGHPVLWDYQSLLSKYLSLKPSHRLRFFFARPHSLRGLRRKHGSCRRWHKGLKQS